MMNTEDTQQQEQSLNTGQRLRLAREKLELSQSAVAERLCLKLSTVRAIEENTFSPDLSDIFIRGYIRSYARLVHIAEAELLPGELNKQTQIKRSKIIPTQHVLRRRRKKHDGWLMKITWLIFLILTGLTGFWWWQNYNAQQQVISAMESTPAPAGSNTTSVSVPLELPQHPSPVSPPVNNNPVSSTPVPAAEQSSATEPGSQLPPAAVLNPPVTISAITAIPADNASTPLNDNTASETTHNSNSLIMKFTDSCWIAVTDATGTTLFSGLKHKNDQLTLNGKAPYQLRIGAPGAVQIHYQGKAVDLSGFPASKVARLTLKATP